MRTLAAWWRDLWLGPLPCPACLHVHGQDQPCEHPLTPVERLELARSLQAIEERAQ